MKKIVVTLLLFLSNYLLVIANTNPKKKIPNPELKALVQKYKNDARGPYKHLNWYCKDGTINPANEPCGKIGGVQHATYKDEVVSLGEQHHIYLGQILASTNKEDFWDVQNYYSRMKQYQVEKYLKSVDNGWINRKAQYYRGATQAEDEQNWGKEFFEWLLQDNQKIEKHFFLLREALKDIPHSGDSNTAQKMRSESKFIADKFSSFNKIRIKIHGNPEESDIALVREFQQNNKSRLGKLNSNFDTLIATMQDYFKPIDISSFNTLLKTIHSTTIKDEINNFLNLYGTATYEDKIAATANLMWYIRTHILEEKTAKGRLALLDVSVKLEHALKLGFKQFTSNNLDTLLNKICYLNTAAAGSGFIEIWEWEQIYSQLPDENQSNVTLEYLQNYLVAARKQLEWGTGKNNAVYKDVVELFAGFEPLTHGFLDDRIRGSILLELGNSIGVLGTLIAKESMANNKVLQLSNQSHIHGLNPGYAKGKLQIIDQNTKDIAYNANDIYVFEEAPSDLKPVVGILTVSEGNLVSHVQLLARNLGIPNAAISQSNFEELKRYKNQEVFYAVSNKGTVIMKPASQMTAQEKGLVTQSIQKKDRITIATDSLKLDVNKVLNLRNVDATFSGIYCGPKAANMGQLKQMFPDHVVEGMVIPFGIFLDHMQQQIPGEQQTYWEFLKQTFETARSMTASGKSAKTVENYELQQLAKLRNLIYNMQLKPSFIEDLNTNFTTLLGAPLGQVPVFLRSDTNMEDLKNFTGAGLNLTLFNKKQKSEIIKGIKAVWASPYEERSFKWRQKYLTNPENVFPSILVIPGIHNECSGVMITKGVASGNDNEITTAFSKGVGGAVDGQVAETWVLKAGGVSQLLSPSREAINKFLGKDSGLVYNTTSFETPILNAVKRKQLYNFSQYLIEKMEANGKQGPFDMELGFSNDKLWLLQIRPFVENSSAKSSEYLLSINPKVNMQKRISLLQKL